jgi:hypothetical protein
MANLGWKMHSYHEVISTRSGMVLDMFVESPAMMAYHFENEYKERQRVKYSEWVRKKTRLRGL